ncbi:MAG: phosphoribosylaminoimidazolesuccinocarboxamide synthase [Acetobacteraceae bacterium]
MHTPDSSRYWRAGSYQARFAAGERPESFDKDFVRAWVVARCDPYHDPIRRSRRTSPSPPRLSTSRAYETITGAVFQLPDPAVSVLVPGCARIWPTVHACRRHRGVRVLAT